MNAAQIIVAALLCGQVVWALYHGATLYTPPCADHTQRLNDQFNSALLFAAILAAGGFWKSAMIEGRIQSALVPPSVADVRGKAFGAVMAQAIADPDFKRLLFERIDDVDARVLPFLIREFSIEEFIEPGMNEAVVRRLLKASYELHARKGYVDGVRTGLAMLGIRVTGWRQWFEEQPKAYPGTHVIILAIDEAVFEAEGRAITIRLQRAVNRMIDGMKRYSQDVMMRFAVEADTPVHVGAVVLSRVTVRPSIQPISSLMARSPLFIGAAVMSRLRISPQV